MVTKISSTVIGANALGTAGIGSNVIIARHLANNAVQSRHLGAGANASQVSENVVALQANLSANIDVVQDNVAAILDATTDLNIGSGKYFFDKSADSFSIANTNPAASSLTLGTPANVIINYGTQNNGGNVIIGHGDIGTNTPHRLDVRGTANTGALTATSFIVPNDGDIGSTGATDAIQIAADGVVTFKDDIKIKDGGTIGTATDAAAITIAAAGAVTFSDRSVHSAGITVADGGQIGSATTAAALTIAGDGAVTVADDLTITGNLTVSGDTVSQDVTNLTVEDRIILAAKNASGSPSLDTGLMVSRGAEGNVFIGYDESVNKVVVAHTRDPHTNTAISATSAANLNARHVTAESLVLSGDAGVIVPDDGNLGSASATDAMQVSSGGIVTFKDDIKIKDTGTIGTATTAAAITLAADGGATFAAGLSVTGASTVTGRSVVGTGLGIVGNTAPVASTFSIGQPANAVIRTHDATGAANIIIGDATATSEYNLDVRGTANVGVILTRGVDPLANDHATFVRLNANLNVVQDNVATASGSTLAPQHNVITTVSGANAYGIGASVTAIDRIEVVLSGVRQTRQFGGSDNDFVIPSAGVVQFVEPAANIPAGLRLMIRRCA